MTQGIREVEEREPGNEVGVNALCERRDKQNALFCKVRYGKNHPSYVHVKYKDVDRLRNGTVHELSCLKPAKEGKFML